jgi:pimeloyl-ACP methyl ester carboxylesterase
MRQLVRCRNRFIGLDRYAEPLSYFGSGGVAEAEALCAEANRDLFEFLRPAADSDPRNPAVGPVVARGRLDVQSWSFDSSRPSGDPDNDCVHVRVYRRPGAPADDRVVLFHNPLYQRHYGLWEFFLGPLIDHVPVAMMAGPWHFERTGACRFPGEGTCNPNPYRLLESLRQWCHDHHAAVRLLEQEARLRVVAEIGYSLGGFHILTLASAGEIDVPLVTVSATNRYAWGLWNGVMGHGLKAGMREVGIDYDRLLEMTREIQVERHVAALRGKPTMYVYGGHDYVDPPPSLERLREALQPMRTLVFPRTGHATVALRARRVMTEVVDFLRETGSLDAGSAAAAGPFEAHA